MDMTPVKLFLLFNIAGAHAALAQPNSAPACAEALIPDTTHRSLNLYQKISVYSLMTEDLFKEAKNKFGAQATFPIGDIVVTPKMDWEDFRAQKDKILNEYKFDSTTASNSNVQTSILSELSVRAYEACLFDKKSTGTVMFLAHGGPTSHSAQIRIGFRTAPGDKTRRQFVYKAEKNAKTTEKDKADLQKPFVSSVVRTITVTRNVDQPTMLSVSVNNAGDVGNADLFIPARPRILKNIPIREVKKGSLNTVINQPFAVASIRPDPGYKLDPGSAAIETVGFSGTVDNHLEMFQVNRDDICTVQANSSASGGLAGGTAVHFSCVQVKDPNWVDVTDRPDLQR